MTDFVQKANTATLFKNHKPNHEKSPHFTGELILETALLRDILEATDPDATQIKLSAALWTKTTKTGHPWHSLMVSKPYSSKQEQKQ